MRIRIRARYLRLRNTACNTRNYFGFSSVIYIIFGQQGMQLCEAVLTRAALVVRIEIGAAIEAAYVSLVKRILGPT